jgi:hypothetical protein
MQPSDEATAEQLQLARAQGDALQRALDAMTRMDAHSAPKRAGDYEVICIAEDAEGMYIMRDGRLEWQEPQAENAHIEIGVRDGADGRFIPGLTVYVTLLDGNGKEIGTHQQPFLWHPWLYHYGRNWQAPGDGAYTVRVRIEAPDFPRHDKINGKRFAEPVEVEFAGVKIKTGQKK